MTSMKKHISAALTAATLTIGLTIPAMAAESPDDPVRVSSYKGSTLEVGERSGLIIGPSGTDYTVTSSDPDTVAVEQMLTFWVDVAKAEGTAEITAFNSAGEHGSIMLTVGPAALITPETSASGDSTNLPDLVLIMDESHHYRAERGAQALNELRPLLGLELTATPLVTKGAKEVKRNMKESSYRSYDELPLFLNAATVAKVLGVSPSSGYELMHEPDFPVLKVGSRLVVPKEKFVEWVSQHTQGGAE